ncbi:MAG: DNA replication and repair protein RecF [Gammaproteobacteria bacterium]|nr:DNA replication and repair protein RecF [Gammaproteobacteria bacterium]
MVVERLDVENVRNIEAAHLELDAGLNLLVGPNGAGKTAALEALHLVFRGRSFRTARTERVVRHGTARLAVGAGCRDPAQGRVRVSYVRDGGRVELSRDGHTVRQSSAIAMLQPIQLLLPDLSDLVFGAPATRRQWLDWGAFHVKHGHAATLRDYLRVLRHRNVLLRGDDRQTLHLWTQQVAELGERVAENRRDYFETVKLDIEESLVALHAEVAVTVDYWPGWRGEDLAETLGEQHDRDVKSGLTNAGPHRADIGIKCEQGDASEVLSRGQGKVVASALRLAQARHLATAGGRSLFLIDDVGAELDEAHSERLAAVLDDMDCQIVATSANPGAGDVLRGSRGGRLFHVEHGRLTAA